MEEVYDTAALVSDDAKLKEEEEEKKIQARCNTARCTNAKESAFLRREILSMLPTRQLRVVRCHYSSDRRLKDVRNANFYAQSHANAQIERLQSIAA